MGTTQQLTFSQGTQLQTVNVTIIDNNIFENTETFSAQLTTSDGRVNIVESSAVTQIVDDDNGMPHIHVYTCKHVHVHMCELLDHFLL